MATGNNLSRAIAGQDDSNLTAALINMLQAKGIAAQAKLKDGILQVTLVSAQVPDQSTLSAICEGVIRLGTQSIKSVKVYGSQTTERSGATWGGVDLDVKNLPRKVKKPRSISNQLKFAPPAASLPRPTKRVQPRLRRSPSPKAKRARPTHKWRTVLTIAFFLGLGFLLAGISAAALLQIILVPEGPNPQPTRPLSQSISRHP